MDIILTSALCKDVYPDNKGGDFRNVLNKPLEFTEPGESWAVALSEISYLPDSWYNVRENYNTVSIGASGFKVYGKSRRLIYLSVHPTNWANVKRVKRNHGAVDIEFNIEFGEQGWEIVRDELLGSPPKDVFFQAGWSVKDMINSIPLVVQGFPTVLKLGEKRPKIKPIFVSTLVKVSADKAWVPNQYEAEIRHFIITAEGARYHDKTEYLEFQKDAESLLGSEELGYATYKLIPNPGHPPVELPWMARDGVYLGMWVYDPAEDDQVVLPSEVSRDFAIQPGQYATVAQLLTELEVQLHRELKIMLQEAQAHRDLLNLVEKYKVLTLIESSLHGVKCVRIGTGQEFCKSIKFKFSMHPALQFQLGFIDYMSYDVGWVSCDQMLTASGGAVGRNPPDLSRNALRSMWVFCDIVESSLVCDRTAQLLRFMPVDSTSHQISFETFGTLIFRPLSKTTIRDIRVWFSESFDGKPLTLLADTVVRLQFSQTR